MTGIGSNEARWTALGTSVHVMVADGGAIDEAAKAVRRVLDEVDATYSRFRDDSELSSLNRYPGRTVRLSLLLFTALEAALRAARTTDGAVDPTIGHVLRLLGYDRDFAALPPDAPGPVIERVPGWQVVELDSLNRTARIPRGVELDLGSTGKALAADLAAVAAHQAAGCGLLVNLGGDIATAGEPPPGGWRIRCADSSSAPTDEGSPDDVVAIYGDAVATSSTTVRRWTAGGIVRHHIVDPATGLPAQGPWRTSTVVAGNCVDANIAATAAIVLGADAVPWLQGLGLPARLIARDGQVRRIGEWPAPLTRAA